MSKAKGWLAPARAALAFQVGQPLPILHMGMPGATD